MPSPRALRLSRRFGIAAAALTILAAFGVAARHRPDGEATNAKFIWSPAAWNLPLDNWGQGEAWQASFPDGAQIRLFARTKTGFCNCFNGIADDTEIDRIGDVDLHGDNFSPSAAGEVIAVGELQGRERRFQTSGRWTGTRHVLSIVAATDCKAVVATFLVSEREIPPAAENSAMAMLTSAAFRRWAADQ